jgi:predicted amidohydrolase
VTQITCCQLSPVIADLDANLRQSTEAIRAAVANGARVVILPELATSGYVFETADEARTVAIAPDHAVFAEWAAIVMPVDGVVVVGFAELGHDGLLYNSAAVVDGTGVLAVYRKVHLWAREKLVFEPGNAVPPVVDTPVGKVGVLICFDLEFPEFPRSLALRGAELIAAPTNWPRETVPVGERVPEVTVAMASAYSNHVAIACCDRAGLERGQEWNEASCIIDDRGWIVATANEAAVVNADLDLSRSRDKAIGNLVDVFGDRRPELYSVITSDQHQFLPSNPKRRTT